MTLPAQSIIQRAVVALQDDTSIRWPVNELVRSLNDGQREILIYRPDALNIQAEASLVAGARQSLRNAGLTPVPSKLIEITHNTAAASAKKAVRLIERRLLDAHKPGWHSLAGTVDIQNYMFDARDPCAFYVYPPALSTAKLEVMFSALPVNITEPAGGALYGAVAGDISLPDLYGNALLDYILYRAYSKDGEYAGNAQRAQAHYAAFASSMGIEVKATVAVQPQAKPGTQNMGA